MYSENERKFWSYTQQKDRVLLIFVLFPIQYVFEK